ncbi:MAG: DUF3800 domain-containing protein [Candidatus Kapaibacterium sp.]
MKDLKEYHRFIDEAGDSTFYLNGKKSAIGTEGVSHSFILGMVKISEPLKIVREKIISLQHQIAADPFYDVPSVIKKKARGGYYLHATDDLPEIRKQFFDLINTIDCSLEAVVGRKSIERFETRHKGKEEYFYADLLSHLLKNKFQRFDKLVLNISERGKSTKHTNLNLALLKAKQRFGERRDTQEIKTNVLFEVLSPTREPLLNLADYLCWAVQRVFERGEIRYYNLVREKISLVIDLYDTDKISGWKNHYDSKKNPLTAQNKISPHIH